MEFFCAIPLVLLLVRWPRTTRGQAVAKVFAFLALVLGTLSILRRSGAAACDLLHRIPASDKALSVLEVFAAYGLFILAISVWRRAGVSPERPRRAAVAVLLAVLGLYLAWTRQPPLRRFYGVITQPWDYVEDVPYRPHTVYKVNHFGFRGPEWDIQKKPGTLRVATIGDSFVFGTAVESEDSLAVLLQARLAAATAGPVEVLNLGIGGANIETEARMVQLARNVLDADAVLLYLTPGDERRFDQMWFLDRVHRPSTIGLACFLFSGPAVLTALDLWDQMGGDPEDRFFSEKVAELAKDPGRKPPLFVFNCCKEPTRAWNDLSRLPETRLIHTPPFHEEQFLPVDGHPMAPANHVFADLIAAAMTSDPLWPRLQGSGWTPALLGVERPKDVPPAVASASAVAPAPGASASSGAAPASAEAPDDFCDSDVEAWAKAASRRTGLTITSVSCFPGVVRLAIVGAGCDFEVTRTQAFKRTTDGAFGVSPIVNVDDWSQAPEPMRKALTGILSALDQDPSLQLAAHGRRKVQVGSPQNHAVAGVAGALLAAALVGIWRRRRKAATARPPS